MRSAQVKPFRIHLAHRVPLPPRRRHARFIDCSAVFTFFFLLVFSDRLCGVITNAFVSETAPVPNACSATIPHSTHSG